MASHDQQEAGVHWALAHVSAAFSLNINEESAGIVSLQRYDLQAIKGLARKEDDRTGQDRDRRDGTGIDWKASAQIDDSAA